MKSFQINSISVNVCNNIIEWAVEFYDMPNNATIDNIEEVTSECMGFADIDNKIIWVYLPDNYDLIDLKKTIAHEVGHLQSNNIIGGEEVKANYYEDYFILVDKIINKVIHNPDNFS